MALPEHKEHHGLPFDVWEQLSALFKKYPSIRKVTLYGSRAKGNYRPNSDIDLILTAPDMSWAEFNHLEQGIDDLLLPWKVDLALKHHVDNGDLLAHVDRVGIVIYRYRDAGEARAAGINGDKGRP